MTISSQMQQIGKAARDSARILAQSDSVTKILALTKIAEAILNAESEILKANQEDIAQAKAHQQTDAFIERLLLNPDRVNAMASGAQQIAALPDPIGTVLASWTQPNGMQIDRIRVPLGVIGVIYESRPNVTADASSLCLKAGNAVILRGGSESFHSTQAILKAIHQGLTVAHLPETCVQMLPSADRAYVTEMLHLDKYIDVIVPRGGKSLIAKVTQESRIPLFKHLEGICHTYIHQAADKIMAKEIVFNAKMRRPGICGATETILIDKAVVVSHLPIIIETLLKAGCEVRGDELVVQCDPKIKLATASDWETEYLAPIVSIKTVRDVNEAISHINQHGSQHTDAIVTNDEAVAEQFLNSVDSAIVMHNTSTQFADGGEFGMGAEIGIATGKLHARGPVGVEQLTTFKYQVRGSGQTRPS